MFWFIFELFIIRPLSLCTQQVSLRVHPDRATPEDRETSTKKFQALGATYKILSDADSKALYDESGEIHDENDPILSDPNRDWEGHWRMMFAKVTLDDIKNFEKQYRDSDEEKADLKKAYLEGEGDMGLILDSGLLRCFLIQSNPVSRE